MPPRFFIPDTVLEGALTLSEEDSHHMRRVLRMRPGDEIIICDARGHEGLCVLDAALCPVVREVRDTQGEPAYSAHLYPSISKGERMDWLLQKAVELGAASVTPVLSVRCNATAPEPAKQRRWQRILRQAAEQCGRGIIPELRETLSFQEALQKAPGLRLFCYEEARGHHLRDEFANLRNDPVVSIFTGPEGGYSPEEVALALKEGLRPLRLGERILRSETAPLFVLSALLYTTL